MAGGQSITHAMAGVMRALADLAEAVATSSTTADPASGVYVLEEATATVLHAPLVDSASVAAIDREVATAPDVATAQTALSIAMVFASRRNLEFPNDLPLPLKEDMWKAEVCVHRRCDLLP